MALTLSEVASMLKASPKSWNDLTAQQKTDVRDALAPVLGFNAPQRAWFGDWWFICTQANVDAMNALLPANTRIAPVSYQSALYLNMDLATDCMQAGDTYAAARPTLRTLVCTNIPNLADLLPKTAP